MRRHDRGVDDPQPADAAHRQARVDHGVVVNAHPAGPDSVKQREPGLPAMREKSSSDCTGRARRNLLGDIPLQRLGGGKLAANLQRGDHRPAVGLAFEEIEQDRRRLPGIRALQPDRPPRVGPDVLGKDREARERPRREILAGAPGHQRDHHVDAVHGGIGAHEDVGIVAVARHRPAAEEEMRAMRRGAAKEIVGEVVDRHRLAAAIFERRRRNDPAGCSPTPGMSMTTGMPMRLQMRGRADARQLQELRRIVGAAANDHLLRAPGDMSSRHRSS